MNFTSCSASYLLNRGNHADAIKLLRGATATIGDIATWKWLGDALWASGDHVGAIGIYREAIDRQASMAAPYRWLGSALTSLGRLVEAEEAYKEAQLRSDELAPWKWLAELYERHGREQEALDLLREAKARF